MFKRFLFLAVAATLLGAGPAAAVDPGGEYDSLSSGNQKIVDSLHFFQEPPEGTDPLTRDQIAEHKADTGWGQIFKNLKADGFFDEYRNLGQLVSSWNHEQRGLHLNGPGQSWKPSRSQKVSLKTNRGRRPQRVQRFNRPQRPKRPKRVR